MHYKRLIFSAAAALTLIFGGAMQSFAVPVAGQTQVLEFTEDADAENADLNAENTGTETENHTNTEGTAAAQSQSTSAEITEISGPAADIARAKAEAEAQKQAEAEAKKAEEAAAAQANASVSMGQQIANYAKQFVGNPYRYGGTSLTKGADCSGFVQSVYRHFGISLPRTSSQQSRSGKAVSGLNNARPGDLITYPGHIGIYIGNNQIVHASNKKDGIKISPANYRSISSIRRIV